MTDPIYAYIQDKGQSTTVTVKSQMSDSFFHITESNEIN